MSLVFFFSWRGSVYTVFRLWKIITKSVGKTVLAKCFLVCLDMCKRVSNKGSIVLLDLVEAELRCSKADPKPSISSVGRQVIFLDRWKFTYIGTFARTYQDAACSLVEWTWRRALHCRWEVETNVFLAVDLVRLWSGFHRSSKKSSRWPIKVTSALCRVLC